MGSKEKWIELFEQTVGRKPTAEEFMKGKQSDFSSNSIHSITGLDTTDSFVSAPIENNANPTIELFDIAEEPLEDDSDIAPEIFDIAEESFEEQNNFSVNPGASSVSVVAPPKASKQNEQAQWISAFEQYVGRKPTPDEFLVGKSQGYDLTTIHQFLKPTSEMSKTVKSSMPKWQKILIALLVVVIVGGIAGYHYAYNHYFSQEAVVENYLKVAGKNFNKAITYEVWSDTKKEITKSDLKYTNTDMVKVTTRKALLSGSAMTKVGQKYLIFPDWRVSINPVSAKVKSNTKGLSIAINGKTWQTTDSENFSKTVSRLYPGTYDFTATGTVNNQKVNVSSQEELHKNTNVDLDVSYMSFTVKSNLSDGDLYMGSTKLGTLTSGEFSVDKAAVNASASLYVKKTFEDGSTTKSETKLISDMYDGDTVSLDADGILSRDVANDLIEAAYSKLNSYASYHTTPDNLDDVFKGSNTNGFYKDVVDMIETNTTNAKNRSADSISFREVDVTKVTQTGAKTYTVDFSVLYDFYYGYDSKFDSSGDIEQKMSWSAKVEYIGNDNKDDGYYYDNYQNYVITDKNGKSSVLNTKNTVD